MIYITALVPTKRHAVFLSSVFSQPLAILIASSSPALVSESTPIQMPGAAAVQITAISTTVLMLVLLSPTKPALASPMLMVRVLVWVVKTHYQHNLIYPRT